MRLSYLIRGLPGHPIHPPLTDATIGIYTASTAFAVLSVLGIGNHNPAYVWWLTLVFALVVTTAPTALTGLADWLTIDRSTPLWRTATAHMVAMLTATVLFGLAAIVGHRGYVHGSVNGAGFAFTIVGFAVLALGGWLGGSIVYVHGMRVLNLVGEPSLRAVAAPLAPEKEEADSD